MLDRSDALSLGRFGSASAPKLGVFPLDGLLGSVNKSLSTGTRIPKRVMGRQFTFRYICLCYSGRKRYNPSPGSSRYSHKGSIGPGGDLLLGSGCRVPASRPVRARRKTPQHSWAPPLRLAGGGGTHDRGTGPRLTRASTTGRSSELMMYILCLSTPDVVVPYACCSLCSRGIVSGSFNVTDGDVKFRS